LRLCVISPFVDKHHGTERALAELLERLAGEHDVKINLYAQQVAELRFTTGKENSKAADGAGPIRWIKVSSISGPHLIKFLWWYFANRAKRRSDRRSGQVACDLLYSPGINAADAEAITVHIVFHALYEKLQDRLSLRKNSLGQWPILIHRRLYYRLLCALEKRIYGNKSVALSAVSKTVANQLKHFFDRSDVIVVRHGVDTTHFRSTTCLARREVSRAKFGIATDEYVFLLIGNDLRNKGLDTLLMAMASCRELPVRLLVVGKDAPDPYLTECERLGLGTRVTFLQPSSDVLQFYAAADAYVGPSLEDAYGLPILEAMACGLPVIASAAAGVSEVIVDGENGLVLRNPRDASELAALLRKVSTSLAFKQELGIAAERTARNESWDVHAARMLAHFQEILARKKRLE